MRTLRYTNRLVLCVLFAVAVAGCVAQEPEPRRVRVGMSRDDLRFYFGEPLRIEAVGSGAEDWFYRCVLPSEPQVDGAVTQDVVEGSGSVSVSVSTSPGSKGEWPIHLSPEGYVIEPLPEVQILAR